MPAEKEYQNNTASKRALRPRPVSARYSTGHIKPATTKPSSGSSRPNPGYSQTRPELSDRKRPSPGTMYPGISSVAPPVGAKRKSLSDLPPHKLLEIQRRRELKRKRIRRNRIMAGSVLFMIIVFIFAITTAIGASSGAVKYHKIFAASAKAHLVTASTLVVKGVLPKFAWPNPGEGAVYVMGEGLVAHSADQQTVPIASLTKMMTAYIILKDHPLGPNENGPSVAINQADVSEYIYDDQNDLSNVKVVNGEVLTERQLLEALLIPSGDNIADVLAKWDAGSVSNFVAKMNLEARILGLPGTHYVDANGVNHGSSSTAADQVKLAALLMRNQVVRAIVRNNSLPFPVVGTITNYNPALGQDGIIGVKSGFTGHAGGCLVVAAYDKVGNKNVLLLVGVTGQKNGLYQAATADETLLAQARKVLRIYSLPEKNKLVGYVRPSWSMSDKVLLKTENHALKIVAWPTMKVRLSLFVPNLSLPGRPRLSRVGKLEATDGGNNLIDLPVLNLQPTTPLPSDYKILTVATGRKK